MKSREEIMEILEAFDLTRSVPRRGELAGCSHHTVARWVGQARRGRVAAAGRAAASGPDHRSVPGRRSRSGSSGPTARSAPMSCSTSCAALGFDGFGAHGAPGGRRGEGQPIGAVGGGCIGRGSPSRACGRSGTGAKGPRDRRAAHDVVLRVVGVVAVPGGDPDVGPHDADADRLSGPVDARLGWGADVLADRQREARSPSTTSPAIAVRQPADRRRGRPLRGDGRDVRAVRSRVQGRLGGDGAGRQGRPGPDRRQPAGGVPSWAELVDACEAFMAEVNGRPHRVDPAGTGRRCWSRNSATAPAARVGLHGGVRRDPQGVVVSDDQLRRGHLLGAAHPRR